MVLDCFDIFTTLGSVMKADLSRCDIWILSQGETVLDWILGPMRIISIDVMIPIVPLHIPCSISELLRYITRAPGCRRTKDGRFVFDLNMRREWEGSHCSEFTKSDAWDSKKLFGGTGSMLHIDVLIC
ncbi:unnamed protein product [Rhizophagus irregularis]|nr:unnamed protein product [Rhizophagus irregularis]CAB4417022.1 unnamed protein product [Rhizophagus irregularis]